jgi:excisionase family DNA binding protein
MVSPFVRCHTVAATDLGLETTAAVCGSPGFVRRMAKEGKAPRRTARQTGKTIPPWRELVIVLKYLLCLHDLCLKGVAMKPVVKLPDVLTLQEAARYLRISKETVNRLADQGVIPSRRINRQWRFLKAALNDWLLGERVPDGRKALLQQAGAFKDDETLPALRAAIYAARGRPEVEGGSAS